METILPELAFLDIPNQDSVEKPVAELGHRLVKRRLQTIGEAIPFLSGVRRFDL